MELEGCGEAEGEVAVAAPTEIFMSKSAEFQEPITSILGLKLSFYPKGQVWAMSVHDLCAPFVFQPMSTSKTRSDGGKAKMYLMAQGEGGPQDLLNLMRYWITKCIAGLLARGTLECYDIAKMRGAGNVPM